MKRITEKDFLRALKEIELSPSEAQLLRTHLRQSARAVTATNLARKMGYRGYRGINGVYGRLGNKIGRVLGLSVSSGIGTIAEFVAPRTQTNDHWLLILKPEFATALQKLGL